MVRDASNHFRASHHLHDLVPLSLSAPSQVHHQQNGKNRENRAIVKVKNPFNLIELQRGQSVDTRPQDPKQSVGIDDPRRYAVNDNHLYFSNGMIDLGCI